MPAGEMKVTDTAVPFGWYGWGGWYRSEVVLELLATRAIVPRTPVGAGDVDEDVGTLDRCRQLVDRDRRDVAERLCLGLAR